MSWFFCPKFCWRSLTPLIVFILDESVLGVNEIASGTSDLLNVVYEWLLVVSSICIFRIFTSRIIVSWVFTILTLFISKIRIISIISSILVISNRTIIYILIINKISRTIILSAIITNTIIYYTILSRIIRIRAIFCWVICRIRWIIFYYRIWKVWINSRPSMILSTPKKWIIILLLLTRNLCCKIRF